jgi:hypothetical protein
LSSPEDLQALRPSVDELAGNVGTLATSVDGLREEMGKEVAALARYGRRNRLYITLTAVLVIAVVVFAGLGLHNRASIGDLRQSTIQGCQAGNTERSHEVQLWKHIAAVSKIPAADTPAQKAEAERKIAGLLQYIEKTFAPRHCAQAYES